MTIRPLRRRLVLAYIALMLLVWAVAGGLFYRHVAKLAVAALTEDLGSRARLVRDLAIAQSWPWPDNAVGDEIAARLAAVAKTRVTVIAPDGRVLAESSQPSATMVNHADRPEFLAAIAEGTGVSQRYSETTTERMMYLGVTLADTQGSGRPAAVVRVATSMELVWARLAAIRNGLLAALGGSLALAAALGLGLGHQMVTRPLESLSGAARQWLAGRLDARIDLSSGDEWQVLGVTFNEMASSLETQLRALRDERLRLHDTFERLPDGVLLVDAQGGLLFANARARSWLRLAPGAAEYLLRRSQVLERQATGAAPAADAPPRALDSLGRSVELRELVRGWLTGEPLGPREVPLHGPGPGTIEVTPNWAGAPEQAALVILLHDVSEARRMEAARRDLVANVSHELKTPIGAIRVLAESLASDPSPDQAVVTEFLGRIVHETARLARLVDEMLYLSRLESGVDVLDLADVDLGVLADGAVKALAPLAQAKAIDVRVTRSGDTLVHGDPGRLESAIKALLDNAIKFSPRESTVSVATSSEGDEVSLTVVDRGPGISEEALPRIFERFYKADESRGGPGSGLGLAIVKHVLRAHGGRVFVESALGKGSSFGFALPRSPRHD